MDWFYSLNNQRQGPVAEEKLAELVRQGVVTNSTLVWRQGMKDWEPYVSALSGPTPDGFRRCGECGKVLPAGDMLEYGKAWVCAACKPIFLQRLQEGAAPASRTVWRSGKGLIMDKDAVLPERCVKCNAPAADGRRRKQLVYIPGAVYLLILLSLIIFVIVALIVQKKAYVTYSVCAEHRKKRSRAIWTMLALFGVVLVLFIMAMVNESATLGLLAAALFLGSLIYGVIASRLVHAKKMDKDKMTLGGFGPEFLAQFPEWTGQG